MEFKDTPFLRKQNINCRGRIIDLHDPSVMGIINITPDSFYPGSRFSTPDEVIRKIEWMVDEGVTFVDIGAWSSRPGANEISVGEELKRLENILPGVRRAFPDLLISVDTYRSEVARVAIKDFEADIINDISAGNMDKGMFATIAELQVPYIIMHMKGMPNNMQKNPEYQNITKEITTYLAKKVDELRLMGVNDIIIDPGFGFGKTIKHNFQLLKGLHHFKALDLPLMAGLSRKSTIYNTLGISANEALNGTTVLHTLAIINGANILRVHDVKEAIQVIQLLKAYKNTEG
jgi:dihydropteroate synthase